MTELPFKTKLIEWINNYPYWFRYASNIILEGRMLDGAEVSICYRYFLEDEKLAKIPDTPRLKIDLEHEDSANQKGAVDIDLIAIKDIENVNALSKDQMIKINKHLTIIFGVNGAGKSGYSRLLNNSFVGRGEKRILPNIFNPGTAVPKCTFVFSKENEEFSLEYPDNKDNDAFKKFMVYDTKCARIHLEQENGLLFTPAGFGFFNHLLELFEKLKELHVRKIAEMRPTNQLIHLFLNENDIKNKVAALGAATKDEDIAQLLVFLDDDKKKQDELTVKKGALISLNMASKLLEIQNLKTGLNQFLTDVESLLLQFTPERVADFNHTLENFVKNKKLADEQGVESLMNYGIEKLGSVAWKEFIKSAEQYAVKLSFEHQERKPYPQTGENCLFCLQPLQPQQVALIEAYWQLLRSEASAQMNGARIILEEYIALLANMVIPVFNETSIIKKYMVSTNETELAELIEKALKAITSQKDVFQDKLRKQESITYNEISFPSTKFRALIQRVEQDLQELMKKDTAAELTLINKEIAFLNDKLLFVQQKEAVKKYLQSHRWAQKAEKVLTHFKSNPITSKQGVLFSQHVTEKYLATFIDECKFLDAPSRVKIDQRNAKGQTLRKLRIEGELANNILSEGEQRAISLADFLTEVQIDENNRGVIFDDPVTSLDHERKALIANRLALESKNRQVVVFTHDIAFFLQLQSFAESLEGVSCEYTTIRKFGDAAGIISPELPWVAQKVKERIGYLKQSLVKLKTKERDGLMDEYAFGVKTWYGLLRETWERSVEERLFKGVVQRFSFGIETQKLKKVVINETLIKAIEDGMTEASKWVHDSAAELQPTTPKSDKLDADLKAFESFASSCVAA